MKTSVAPVVSLVGVLIVSMAVDYEAKLGLDLAPLIWAGNLAKDATHTLVAYKLSLSTKALAMITGNRSFRATIAYDSRLERYEDAPAEAVHDGTVWKHLKNIAAVTSAPIPVHVVNELKVEWLPGMKKPVIRLPTLPPLPKVVVPKFAVPKVVMPKFVVPKVVPKVVVPQLPRIMVPKLLVPKVVMAEPAGADVLQAKVDLLTSQVNEKLRHLGSNSAGVLGSGSTSTGHLAGPRYASGYIKGGFHVGHGTGPVTEVHLKSDAAPATGSTVDAPFFHITEQNKTTNNSRPVHSDDNGVMGRYFQFIRANDEGRCVARMVCTMAAYPGDFGDYGRKVVDFFDDVKPSPLSPVAAYKEASVAGRRGYSCPSRYPDCRVEPKYLAQLGESCL
uniref:Putative rhipicephalus family xiv n=1 Tax=Rhipicephalus pulchellus TaxID=72859 RepID=L7LYJ5_RHIPC